MIDTAETDKKFVEKINQEVESATGQPADVSSPHDIPVISGLEELGGAAIAEMEEVGRGIFGGGTTEITENTKGWRTILMGKFRKKAKEQGGELVEKKAA